MVLDEDVYLEHFGVKGMKWGVRREGMLERHRERRTIHKRRKLNKYGDPKISRPTMKQRNARRSRNFSRAHTALGVAVAVVYIGGMLKLRGDKSLFDSINLQSDTVKKSAKDLINAERSTQLSSLIRTHREGHITKEQLVNFKAILNRRYDRRIVEALMNS